MINDMVQQPAEKDLLQAAQKDPEARERSTSGGVLTVRCSETIERQRTIWIFFRSLLDVICGSYMELEHLAKRIRDACLQAALQAYEDAGMQGLCADGRWEAAICALKTVELAPLLREFKQQSAD